MIFSILILWFVKIFSFNTYNVTLWYTLLKKIEQAWKQTESDREKSLNESLCVQHNFDTHKQLIKINTHKRLA